jgi:hypothetical protein
MEFNYLVGLQQVETGMKKQFEYASEPQPERPEPQRGRPTTTQRARLAIGAALYRLAHAIDPATPVPSRQH